MRIIDADALQNLLLPVAIGLEKEYGSLGGAVSGVMQHVDNAPTVDAVQVVRCRECEHYDAETQWCDIHSHFVMPDGEFCTPAESAEWKMFDEDYFCADGERKST